MKLSVRQIEAFRAVMQTNSMTAAAGVMNISQPAVTRLIKDMEATLALTLFRRAGTRISATREATRLLGEVERMFNGLEHIEQVARSIRRFPQGHLNLAAMPIISMGYLPKVVRHFLDDHPDVSLSVHSDSSVNIVDLVAREQFDLGICSVPAVHPNLRYEMLDRVEAVCIMPVGHPLAENAVIVPRNLDGADFVLLGQSSLLRQQVRNVLDAEGITINVRVEALYSTTACGFVEQGVGVSIVDPFVVSGLTRPAVTVRPFRPRIPYEFALIYPPRLAEDHLAIALGTVLREEMKRDFAQDEAIPADAPLTP